MIDVPVSGQKRGVAEIPHGWILHLRHADFDHHQPSVIAIFFDSQRVEGILCLEPEIEQAMVVGDKRKHLAAILVPSAEFLENWAVANGATNVLSELKNY